MIHFDTIKWQDSADNIDIDTPMPSPNEENINDRLQR